MPRVFPTLLLALLVAACSGKNAPSTPPTSTVATAISTQAPESAATSFVSSPSSEQPFALFPVTTDLEGPGRPHIYDTQTGQIEPETPAYAAALRSTASWRIVYLDDLSEPQSPLRIAIYNPGTDSWQAFEIDSPPSFDLSHSPIAVIHADGSRAAAQFPDGRLVLIDLKARTYRALNVKLWPVQFSPNGASLVAGLEGEVENGGSAWVVVDFVDPIRSLRIPLGSASEANLQWRPVWLTDSILQTRTQNNPNPAQKEPLIQLIDVSGTQPRITLEEPIPSEQINVSPDRRLVAIRIHEQGGVLGRPSYEGSVAIFSLDPFMLVKMLPGAALGYFLEVPPQMWSSDSSRLLAILDFCVEDRSRLVSFNLEDGTQTEVARGKLMQFVFSPDGRWVAFTAWPREAWVVAADGGAPPILVSQSVSPWATPAWSSDSRYASFQDFFGGGDYCV